MFRIGFFVLVFMACCLSVTAQTKLDRSARVDRENPFENDTVAKRSKGFKDVAPIDWYLLLNRRNDTAIVDTTLSIRKLYKFNYLQEDNFNLISFANLGQTYNTLSFNSFENSSMPLFGARARHFNYMENEDIQYYDVPTPWTRLTYKTAFSQGQLLDAFFTVNLSRQFNFSLAYKGLRSLGNYLHSLTSTGNLRMTSNYNSKNGRYRARGHMVWQDLLNEENGGIRDEDLENFTSGNEEFEDRAVFDPNFQNAESILLGKRFFLDQQYALIRPKDSVSTRTLDLVHKIAFEDKFFEYNQNAPETDFFGGAFTGTIRDRATLENFQTELKASYYDKTVGRLGFGVNYTDINYGYNSVAVLMNEIIPNRIRSNFLGLSADYTKTFKGFTLSGEGRINLSDDFKGSFIKGRISYQLNKDILLEGSVAVSSRLPNYNYLLYQSDYINYNWYNLGNFENVNTQQIAFSMRSEKYADIDFDISNIDNYTFFNLDQTIDGVKVIRPSQFNNTLQYLRLKIGKEIELGKFGLDNTIMYQSVISDEDVLNVPTLITRNTLYYKDQFFKKAMTFQSCVVFNYFTKYSMNGYDPLLAEFYTQNETELGGFPRLDLFVSAKIRQTRVFLIAEHFNSSFTGFDYFSAPNHPYRDFTIRFGLVWDFFL